MKLHERIQRVREDQTLARAYGFTTPMSFGDLAAITRAGGKKGITPQALTQIVRKSEAGKESGERTLRICADAWGYSLDWLISGRGAPRQKELSAFDRALASENWEPAAIAAAVALRDAGEGQDWAESRWVRLLRDTDAVIRDAQAGARERASDVPTSSPSSA